MAVAKTSRVLITIGFCLVVLGVTAFMPPAAFALTGSHQLIVAYYPIFPRWYTPENCLWIGDPVRQYPLLGLYDNTTDSGVIRFDFACMKNAGATVINPHMFSSSLQHDRLDWLSDAAADAGLMWTPTFEACWDNPAGMANITNAFLADYGSDPSLMRVNNRPVMFWSVGGTGATEQTVAAAIETVRAVSGPVMIILDVNCLGHPCQNCCSGNSTISSWYSDPDASTGYSRASGFYSWVPVGWCMMSRTNRRTHISNFVNRCVNGNMVPVVATTPSYNEENWGYGEEGDNCGIGGDRSGQPHYNTTRSVTEWDENLNDLLYNNHANAWMYIQAYDEWAEGSPVAPTTYGCHDFLARLQQVFRAKRWLCGATGYCRPEYPAGYSPAGCTQTPVCGQGAVIATFEAESQLSHLCGSAITGGWRVNVTSSNCYMAYGPYTTILPAGPLTARFWLRVDNNTGTDANIARLDVWDATAGTQLAVTTVTRRVWCAADVYEPFDLSFTSPGGGHQLEFRTYYFGNARLDLDRVQIVSLDLPAKATAPDPPDQATGVRVSACTGWTAGPGATSHDVYLGKTNPPPFRGNQVSTTFDPETLDPHETYYWRVDEVNGAGATTGDLWRFTTGTPGDYNGDGDVDQEDFGHFQVCLSGDGSPYPPGCDDADLDEDGAVDQQDFSVFQSCLGGADRPPGC